ncbi:MAG: hypothetical protein PHS73_04725 [Candidatus Peribacteraceae bacterium]|nr:hypothetical protein [Candidatus Peribacteraceae bacterium]
MFRITAPIPDNLPGPKNLRTLATRLRDHLGIGDDGLTVHPDCGMFSITRETREQIQELFDLLQARGIRMSGNPYKV